ncbi:hypothetical protein ACFFK0_11450 [Paenibacillus chartarius]|uniref:Uncharacterized protein n=1 Tax=Paenibacillus chartarius TaxID=747481 RepID=A0ABV6DK81_9BACL
MDKFIPSLGGLIGGYALIHTPVPAEIALVLDVVGAIAMIAFSGILMYQGIRSLR